VSPARPVLKAGLGLVAALALSGCISVLPKTKPALLYRFGPGETAAAAPAAAPAARRPVLGLATIDFDSAADTDQILTVTGQDVAYIEGARWSSPAPVLFREALLRAFEASPDAPALVERGAALRAPDLLQLKVEAFEASYDHGRGAAPAVVVRVRATLVSNQTHAVLADRLLSASARASDNRQGPIVAAFQSAVRDVIGQLIAFTSQPPPPAASA